MSKKTKVLVVEDDDSIRHCLELVLGCDFEVFSGNNGLDGLQLKLDHDIKIIITDLNMPIMDGDELCEKIRETDHECKIIALSGHNTLLDQSSKMNIGFNHFLNKPIKFDTVKSIIRISEQELGFR